MSVTEQAIKGASDEVLSSVFFRAISPVVGRPMQQNRATYEKFLTEMSPLPRVIALQLFQSYYSRAENQAAIDRQKALTKINEESAFGQWDESAIFDWVKRNEEISEKDKDG